MTSTQWLLLAHLICAFAFVSGGVVAGVLQAAAMRRERPGDVALLLGLIRPAVALVGAGALGTLVFGIALAHNLSLNNVLWVKLGLGLWVASVVLGWAGGRSGRHTRKLATQLAAADAPMSAELRAAVHDRTALALNALSFAAVLAIIVLMVWQPT